jgi:hypothetical protein
VTFPRGTPYLAVIECFDCHAPAKVRRGKAPKGWRRSYIPRLTPVAVTIRVPVWRCGCVARDGWAQISREMIRDRVREMEEDIRQHAMFTELLRDRGPIVFDSPQVVFTTS